MCVIVTYPKVTAPKRHHPSPACLPHASFCLTDSLKLCLFVCSQSHFHLWSSWAWATIACRAMQRQTDRGGLLALKLLTHTKACHIGYYAYMKWFLLLFLIAKRWSTGLSVQIAAFYLSMHTVSFLWVIACSEFKFTRKASTTMLP